MSKFPSQVTCAPGVRLEVESIECGHNVQIGKGVSIRAGTLILGDDVVIDEDVEIRADYLRIDKGSRIERGCIIAGARVPAKYVHIGEHTLVASESRILVPTLVVGDYAAIHNHALVNGDAPVIIGHNAWIGQNSIVNANAAVTVGNNVGIGAYSSVYTHGFFGDLLEGCQVHKVGSVRIEDDAWILGSYNVISPGVTIGKKALILTGSNVTRDVPPNHCVAGNPARDMTERLVPYVPVSANDKLRMVHTYLKEYVREVFPDTHAENRDGFAIDAPFGPFRILVTSSPGSLRELATEQPLLVFTSEKFQEDPPLDVTVFDVVERTYTRKRTQAEIGTISWLKSYRARFVPCDRLRICLPTETPG